VLKSIKIRLYPSDNQIVYINKLLGASRFIYNKCLDFKIKDSHSKVLQQHLINLEIAYKNFFKSGSGFPKYKSKHDNQASCRFPVDAISGIKGNRINMIG